MVEVTPRWGRCCSAAARWQQCKERRRGELLCSRNPWLSTLLFIHLVQPQQPLSRRPRMAPREQEPESDGESEGGLEWLLGFVERPRKRTDLLRHRFPSKVGGHPAWLDPLHLPTDDQLTCRVTGKPLDFLLQVGFSRGAAHAVGDVAMWRRRRRRGSAS